MAATAILVPVTPQPGGPTRPRQPPRAERPDDGCCSCGFPMCTYAACSRETQPKERPYKRLLRRILIAYLPIPPHPIVCRSAVLSGHAWSAVLTHVFASVTSPAP